MEKASVIKKLIEQTGMSVMAFAEKAGLPYTTLRSMLERDLGKASIENVLKVCKALEITVEEIDELASGQFEERYEALKRTVKIERDPKRMTEILAELIDKQGSRRAFAKK